VAACLPVCRDLGAGGRGVEPGAALSISRRLGAQWSSESRQGLLASKMIDQESSARLNQLWAFQAGPAWCSDPSVNPVMNWGIGRTMVPIAV